MGMGVGVHMGGYRAEFLVGEGESAGEAERAVRPALQILEGAVRAREARRLRTRVAVLADGAATALALPHRVGVRCEVAGQTGGLLHVVLVPAQAALAAVRAAVVWLVTPRLIGRREIRNREMRSQERERHRHTERGTDAKREIDR